MARFYKTHLGFKLERDYRVDAKMMNDIFRIPSRCRIVFLTKDNFSIEFFYFLDARIKKADARRLGYNHWTMMVKDKDQFCVRLKKKGIRVIQIPKPHGFTYFLEDPEKNLIEIKSHELKNSRAARLRKY